MEALEHFNFNISTKSMNPRYDIKVTNRQSFIRFLELLRQDFMQNHSEWENRNLDRFLEAMVEYIQDIQGYYNNTNQNINADIPSWKVFADILTGAKIYE